MIAAGWARIALLAVALVAIVPHAFAEIRIVAVGDSSFRGGPSMANPDDTYPARLEAALRARGYDVRVTNAGVNGETSDQTLRRLDSAVPDGTRIALVCVGGNDRVYRNASRSVVMSRLLEIVRQLRARGIEVVMFRLGGQDAVATRDEEVSAFRSAGAFVLPPMQAGLVERTDLHVERVYNPQTTLWHLNREGNEIAVQHTLPVIERAIHQLP
jgi:acyl-CoA thioesterase-1